MIHSLQNPSFQVQSSERSLAAQKTAEEIFEVTEGRRGTDVKEYHRLLAGIEDSQVGVEEAP